MPSDLMTPEISDNGMKVLKKQLYLWPKAGDTQETPKEMFWRVATFVASAEKEFGASDDEVASIARKFYDSMASGKFIPNTPTLVNAGKDKGQLAACFVVAVDDSTEAIYQTMKNAALIQTSGGGVGYSGANLRPRGSSVSTTGKISGGSNTVLKLYNASAEIFITQGSARRGANMWILPVWHLDILEFIDIKKKDGEISNFNISVAITDDFMNAVVTDSQWGLRDPRFKDPITTIKARDLYNKIINAAWFNGEPGCVFIDAMNRDNPTPHVGQYTSTNPCLTGDMRLLTVFGYRTMEELWEQGGNQDYDSHSKDRVLGVVNSHGIATATNVYRTALKAPVYEVTLNSGQKIRATANHNFFLTDGSKKMLSELEVGDKLPLTNNQDTFVGGTFDYPEYALLAGWVIGDGSITTDTRTGYNKANITMWNDDITVCGPVLKQAMDYVFSKSVTSSANTFNRNQNDPVGKAQKGFDYKRANIASSVLGRLLLEDGVSSHGNKHNVPYSIWNGTNKTIAAFLRGLFSADGTVHTTSNGTIGVRLSQNAESLLRDVGMLLMQLGIKNTVHYNRRPAGTHMMNDGKGGMKEYNRAANHEIIISGIRSCTMFIEKVGFIQPSKVNKAQAWLAEHPGSNNSAVKFETEVESIEYVGEEATYCLTEPLNNEIIVNGTVTSQCAEQPLLPYEACTLGHINLVQFVRGTNGDSVLDWRALGDALRMAVRFLDDVIDVNSYPIPEIEKMHKHGNRKIGSGFLGFADTLIRLGIAYDSQEAREFAMKLTEFHASVTDDESVELAQDRGSFNNFKGSALEAKFPSGIRNACRRTWAPTGSTSIIIPQGPASSGCEPVFGLVMNRNQAGMQMLEVNTALEHYLHAHDITDTNYNEVIEYISKNGTIVGAPHISKKTESLFAQANEISATGHILMQAALQKHTDAAISKTINLPENATLEDVSNAYMLAWKSGCKGVTVYRDKCRSGQVLSIVEHKSPVEIKEGTHLRYDDVQLANTEPAAKKKWQVNKKKITECPECKSSSVSHDSGCFTCHGCGLALC
jgi:ribonucleoside-diphosphate reductase alpha chain